VEKPETCEFIHALIRYSIYTDMSPSRRVRLHRRLAREIERLSRHDAADYALEIAQQWHRSAALPGAEAGVKHCVLAADRAEAAAAHEDAAAALRLALDLAPRADSRRPRLLARLGLSLAWSLAHEEAVPVAGEAAELIAAAEGNDAAADYLADAAEAVYSSAFDARAWALADLGLRYVGVRRDLTWARLAALDLDRRDASDPTFPGLPIDGPERREVSRILVSAISRILGFWAGEYDQALVTLRAALPVTSRLASSSLQRSLSTRWLAANSR